MEMDTHIGTSHKVLSGVIEFWVRRSHMRAAEAHRDQASEVGHTTPAHTGRHSHTHTHTHRHRHTDTHTPTLKVATRRSVSGEGGGGGGGGGDGGDLDDAMRVIRLAFLERQLFIDRYGECHAHAQEYA